jgi:hypothetical protein
VKLLLKQLFSRKLGPLLEEAIRGTSKVVWLRSGNGPSGQVLEILLRSRSIIEHFGEDDGRSLLALP